MLHFYDQEHPRPVRASPGKKWIQGSMVLRVRIFAQYNTLPRIISNKICSDNLSIFTANMNIFNYTYHTYASKSSI